MRPAESCLDALLTDEVTLAALRADGLSMEAFKHTLSLAASRLEAPAARAPLARQGFWQQALGGAAKVTTPFRAVPVPCCGG